ncbi:MAG TPA: hypothetical protein DCG22_07905, partial [Bacteroidetes bacterium]|nr:hypothetical protein [Bacteroidota bacterium]
DRQFGVGRLLKPLGSVDEDYNVIGLIDRWDWLRRPFFQLAIGSLELAVCSNLWVLLTRITM